MRVISTQRCVRVCVQNITYQSYCACLVRDFPRPPAFLRGLVSTLRERETERIVLGRRAPGNEGGGSSEEEVRDSAYRKQTRPCGAKACKDIHLSPPMKSPISPLPSFLLSPLPLSARFSHLPEHLSSLPSAVIVLI